MTAPSTIEERMSTMEDTLKELVTSLPLPDAYLKSIIRDMGTVKHDAAVVRQCVLDLSVESSEIQLTLGDHSKALDKHSRELAEIKSTLGTHGQVLAGIKSTLGAHDRTLTGIMSTVNTHSEDLTEIKSILKVILTKLDER